MVSFLNVLCIFEKNLYSLVIGHSILYKIHLSKCPFGPVFSLCHFNLCILTEFLKFLVCYSVTHRMVYENLSPRIKSFILVVLSVFHYTFWGYEYNIVSSWIKKFIVIKWQWMLKILLFIKDVCLKVFISLCLTSLSFGYHLHGISFSSLLL